MRKKISVVEPIAYVGDTVEVKNYRKKKAEEWERGKCEEVEFRMNRFNGATLEAGSWHYRVRLDRRSQKGKPIFLVAGDANIRRCQEVAE